MSMSAIRPGTVIVSGLICPMLCPDDLCVDRCHYFVSPGSHDQTLLLVALFQTGAVVGGSQNAWTRRSATVYRYGEQALGPGWHTNPFLTHTHKPLHSVLTRAASVIIYSFTLLIMFLFLLFCLFCHARYSPILQGC